MKRLAILVVAGMMGLLLSACGEQAKTSTKTETTVEQTTSGEPAAAPVTEAAPASTDEATSDAGAADAQKPE